MLPRLLILQPQYIKYMRIRLSILTTLCFLLLSQRLAAAQTTTLTLSPPVTELLLRPNIPVQQTFILKISGSNPTITPSLHLVTPSDTEGHVTIDPNPVNPASLPVVVTSNPPLNQPLATAGQDLGFTLTLSAANTDATLDSYLALVFTTTDPNTSESSAQAGISALLFLTVTPDGLLPIDLSLSEFNPPTIHDSSHPLTLAPIVANQTDSMIRPQGLFTVTSPRGNPVATQELYPNLILGHNTRQLKSNISNLPSDLTWHPAWYSIGPHTLTLTLTSQGGKTLTTAERVVWLLPLRPLFIICSLIIIVTLTIRRSSQLTRP